ncbi:MAG TPA: hypothetical protein VMT35_05250, partial [Ignavibacteriaceae bacterium]|nr:hypothetical protein [Ignavibacteriaceae bacterium]
MGKTLRNLAFILPSILFFFGCATVEQTIYLGDVEVTAPITPPPTHIKINKEAGAFTISPRFSAIANKRKEITGSTGDSYHGSFVLSDNSTYRAKRENIQWNVMEYVYGADLDIQIGEITSLFGGINFSSGNNTNFTGGNLGIGFHSLSENSAVRFDIGINIQKYNYLAVTIVNTKTSSIFGHDESTDIFCDKGNSVNVNPFITLTVNSAYSPGFLNYFGSIGIFTQSLLDFTPGETDYSGFPFIVSETTVDERADFTSYLFYFNPGLAVSLNNNVRMILSAKIIK